MDEEQGMLRMSFLEHLTELRSRILRALVGFGVIFIACMAFSDRLWLIVQAPAVEAFRKLGSGGLVGINAMEQFEIIWMWTPLVASLFLGSPWILYQVWAFIAPGLYERERKWAIPFVLTTAGLFLLGGLFAYFLAFRYGLTFLLGIGKFAGVTTTLSIDSYFDLFVDVMLGVSLIFEMPVVIFFLVLLRIATPKFLMEHSRYAILGIVIIAAVITPTVDFVNLSLFAVPMCLLFFIGVFAGYLLQLHRDSRRFPWVKATLWILGSLAILGAAAWLIFHSHWFRKQIGAVSGYSEGRPRKGRPDANARQFAPKGQRRFVVRLFASCLWPATSCALIRSSGCEHKQIRRSTDGCGHAARGEADDAERAHEGDPHVRLPCPERGPGWSAGLDRFRPVRRRRESLANRIAGRHAPNDANAIGRTFQTDCAYGSKGHAGLRSFGGKSGP